MATMRSVVLKAPIAGLPQPGDFTFAQSDIPALDDHQFLIEHRIASVDPGVRSRLSATGASYAPPIPPGERIDGFVVGQVTESRNTRYPVGSWVTASGGWGSHSISDGRGYILPLSDNGLPRSLWLGILGIPGMTSWFGLKRVGQMREGAHVLVTSAAGVVGATAGQLARAWGAASVVGIAGGQDKCDWLVSECGFDAAIDYKAVDDLDAAIAAACPKGVDILFDNVGNAMVDRVLPMMRLNGHIIVSGQVADYNVPLSERAGITNTGEFIAKRLTMRGILVFDDIPQFAAAQAEMGAMIADGTLVYREEMFEGLEAMPEAFCGLFTGASFGRRLVRLGDY
ncbi:NADP-dependent oxidoreductase [Blastomonas sp.]|uniref:NADP-dependent oxidoreductase n=1 Tax=Blastomonas sp. TaxID=1909299 RepID=UPI00262CC739|nr:NADP-dependent oxidoreductase [Blastomonas sp.]MDM7957119.1 NADP-dependent oxidoreductase [Blastomonas sp.]